MQLLVSDANIPIDIEHGNLTSSMFSMKIVFAVPDPLNPAGAENGGKIIQYEFPHRRKQ